MEIGIRGLAVGFKYANLAVISITDMIFAPIQNSIGVRRSFLTSKSRIALNVST